MAAARRTCLSEAHPFGVLLTLITTALASMSTMKCEEISQSVVYARNEQGANLVCLALRDELIFVDSGLNKIVAANFRNAMKRKFNKNTGALVLTHAHVDHFFGMSAFSDVEVVAAEAGKSRFERFVNADYSESLIENISRVFPHFRESVGLGRPFMPNVWVKDEMVLGEGEQKAVFQVVGGHSNCSSSIHHVPDQVIVAGDLVQVDVYPYFGETDTDVEKWIHALGTWESMDIDAVVPGHGRVVKKDYLPGVRTFFQEMLSTLRDLKAEGVSVEEVIHHPRLPSGYWGKEAIRKPPYDASIANLYKKL